MVIFDKNLYKAFPDSVREYVKRRALILGNLCFRKCIALMIILEEEGFKVIDLKTLRKKIRRYIATEKSQVRKYFELLEEYELIRKKNGLFILNCEKIPRDPEIRQLYLESLYLKRGMKDYYDGYRREFEVLKRKVLNSSRRMDDFMKGEDGVVLKNVSLSPCGGGETCLETKERIDERQHNGCYCFHEEDEDKKEKKEEEYARRERQILTLPKNEYPEFQIFYAEPLKSEPDKAKISWKGDSDG